MEDNAYWYQKGIGDFSNFIVELMPDSEKEKMNQLRGAIQNQLMRNVELLQKLLKK